ncbi:MAG: aminoglycoside 6-adenylyltransferase [Gemmatimonadota bacterium]|nr:aminoglycoside 6-adenylyltransferase [Gemmatimonadota bacterium]
MISSLVAWIESEEDVRAAALVGSRAMPEARVDRLSDYDVLLFVRDPATYATGHPWWEAFGPVLVTLRERYELAGRPVPTRLVQYEDGVRIDFSLLDLEIVERIAGSGRLPDTLEAGYRVLVDKDDRLSRLPDATGGAYIPAPPDETAFRQVVEEFWWEATCVAKHLARGEALPARYSGECVLRFECLVPMIEWYVEGSRGWDAPLGARGRGLASLLDEAERSRLRRTFAGAGIEESWEALFTATGWFADMARAIADDLGFASPDPLAARVETFLRAVREGVAGKRGPPSLR